MNTHKLKYDHPSRAFLYIPLFPHQHLLHQPNPERSYSWKFKTTIPGNSYLIDDNL